MQKINPGKPVVLVFSGHDPSGCAGLHADIETIAAHGCHAASVITLLTTQTVDEFVDFITPDIDAFRRQGRMLLESMDIRSIKIGAIGDENILESLIELLDTVKNIPVVLDPVMASTSGFEIMNESLRKRIISGLLPLVDVLTPNSNELRFLSLEENSTDAAVKCLLEKGCRNLLLTGTHESTHSVINALYRPQEEPFRFEFERLPGEFRGSGCILSSGIAANLASGLSVTDAVAQALEFTWNCLASTNGKNGDFIIPDRANKKLMN